MTNWAQTFSPYSSGCRKITVMQNVFQKYYAQYNFHEQFPQSNIPTCKESINHAGETCTQFSQVVEVCAVPSWILETFYSSLSFLSARSTTGETRLGGGRPASRRARLLRMARSRKRVRSARSVLSTKEATKPTWNTAATRRGTVKRTANVTVVDVGLDFDLSQSGEKVTRPSFCNPLSLRHAIHSPRTNAVSPARPRVSCRGQSYREVIFPQVKQMGCSLPLTSFEKWFVECVMTYVHAKKA